MPEWVCERSVGRIGPVANVAFGRFCGRVLARTRNDGGQVEPVPRTVASLVLFDSCCASLEESASSDAVTAGGMGQADTNLRETLPQVAFFVRTSLPAGLQDLVRSERPAFLHQPPGQIHCLHRQQGLFRNWIDAGSPIGQRAAKSISRASLPWTTSVVPVSAPIAGHCGHRPTRSSTTTVVIHQWYERPALPWQRQQAQPGTHLTSGHARRRGQRHSSTWAGITWSVWDSRSANRVARLRHVPDRLALGVSALHDSCPPCCREEQELPLE